MSAFLSDYCPFRKRLYQVIRLSNLIRRLLKSSLRRLDPSVALFDVFLHVTQIIVFETPFRLLGRRSRFILGFQRFAVHLGTRSKILFSVGELIVWTSADKVGAADLGVCNRQLRVTGAGTKAHELVSYKKMLVYAVYRRYARREAHLP